MQFHFDSHRALELLREGTGNPEARFRDGQLEAIEGLVSSPKRLLVVQRTGWGKSMVYFIATKILRDKGMGVGLLVSPLLALMRNQLEAAAKMGLVARTINSDNRSSWEKITAEVQEDEVDLLLISPERLANEQFKRDVLDAVSDGISLLIIDEAHCISDWGHDFRPHYRLITRLVQLLPTNTRLLATTATANDRVTDDLDEILGPGLTIIRGSLNRAGLTLETHKMDNAAKRLAWLDAALHALEGSGIIYVLTQRDALRVSEWLTSRGHDVAAYTAGSGDIRPELEQALLENRLKALVATVALGMGFDKPDLAFVLHYQMPGSVIAYYQQVGRAGRGIEKARGILLHGVEDDEIHAHFIKKAFPSRRVVERILEAVGNAEDGLSKYQILRRVNVPYGQVDKALKLLSLESPAPIVEEDKRWYLTATQSSEAFWERAERLTSLREEEWEQMKAFIELPHGEHMPFLMSALDSRDGAEAAVALQAPLHVRWEGDGLLAAEKFLRHTWRPIEPRKQWPRYAQFEQWPIEPIKIPEANRAQSGWALCYYGDSFWGSMVKAGKYDDGRFSDELVPAMCEMIRAGFEGELPAWMTCVPSTRHPELVPDFAAKLADALGIEFYPIVRAVKEKTEQKVMENSQYQLRNLDRAFELTGPVPSGSGFLFDDMVDSRWTMTVIAFMLLDAGANEVHPIALALSTAS